MSLAIIALYENISTKTHFPILHHIACPSSAQTCFSSIPAPISNLAPVLALTSSSVAPGISSIKVIFPAFRSISKTAYHVGENNNS